MFVDCVEGILFGSYLVLFGPITLSPTKIFSEMRGVGGLEGFVEILTSG